MKFKIFIFAFIIVGEISQSIFCYRKKNYTTDSDEDRPLQLDLGKFIEVKNVVKKVVSKFKIYYGDNDRPVLNKLADIKNYLNRFGYIDYVKRLIMNKMKSKLIETLRIFNIGQSLTDSKPTETKSMAEIVVAAIKLFQRFMRLAVTGTVDSKTLGMMNKPRCANKDLGEQRRAPTFMTLKVLSKMRRKARKKLGSREKRHALAGSRWQMTNITYKITKYPSSFRNKRSVIDKEIAKALKFWSDVTPLTFTKLPSITPSSKVIIDIRFEKGEHGDGDPHDGVGKVLAHAYFPQYGGDAHFDDDEQWTVNSNEGSNVLMAAIHELGHSLGLDHSDAPDSVMGPIYPPYKPDRELTADDIRAIQLLYGSKTGVPDVPNLCTNASIDGMVRMSFNSIFVFKGKHIFRVKSDEMSLDSDYPKLISEKFPTIEGEIDDAIQMADGSTFIFQDEMCYKFQNFSLVEGFPKNIKDLFPSLPTHIEAAVHLDGIIYAFKANMFWEYIVDNEGTQEEKPKPIKSKWPAIPDNVNAVFEMSNRTLYFFKDQEFYRLNKFGNKYKLSASNPPYPRKIALWWFGCQ